jgi:AcrR family transcriptional regulator
MPDALPLSTRDRTRADLVKVAADLLAEGGPGAVTTRSVAQAAGVQAPAIYRLFGDKIGLLSAVVEDGYASYADAKHIDADSDPVADLRAGWELHVGFGLENPALFRLMHTGLRSLAADGALERGAEVLRSRVRRVAGAGRLAVAEPLAIDLVRATATGAVFTLLDGPAASRDALIDAAWRSLAAVILVPTDDHPPADDSTAPTRAAVTLAAALPTLDPVAPFTPGERALLSELLARLAD